MSKRNIILGAVIVLLVGGSVAYALSLRRPVTKPQPVTTAKNEPAPDITPAYQEKNVPLNQVPNYQAVAAAYGLKLTDGQEKSLDQNKFLLVDLDGTSFKLGYNFDQMLTDFDSLGGSSSAYYRKPENTKLITPDIVLHAYHRYFEITLEQLEKNELSKNLSDFLTALHSNLAAAVRNNSGYPKERYENLEAQLVLARVLFENKSPAKPDYFQSQGQETAYLDQDKTIDSASNAKKILAKYSTDLTPGLVSAINYDLDRIYDASDVGVSPLFSQYSDDLVTDYTQYTPRSHYSKNSILRAYFKTMMYLGRSSYFLKKDIGIADANLLAKQIAVESASGVTPLEPWNKIMAVTGFYAGQSDDLTYTEWKNFETQILGAVSSDSDLSSADTVAKLAGDLNQLRLPKILSDVIVDDNIANLTKPDLLRDSLAFRIFGQRFTFDAWILNDLTAGQEKTEVKLPSTPSALFVPAALGDLRAGDFVQEFLRKDAGFSQAEVAGFLTKLDQKKSDIVKVTKDEWFASMGGAWLYVLGSLTHDFGKDYPLYMRAVSFLDKQIQTCLGSYTELKHDTLLYAKQSYAERGGGGEEVSMPPLVKGFVEPNLEFWNKFNELLNRTEEFFVNNNLLKDSNVLARLKSFESISAFYGDFAKKELQGQPISDDDYEKLRTTNLAFMADPLGAADIPDENSGKVALIADIHTDAIKNQILYEATGKPYLMLAIVANEQTPRVAASLVYNHYEFTNPLTKRLTDENWRGIVYDQTNKLPAKNFWYNSLLVK